MNIVSYSSSDESENEDENTYLSPGTSVQNANNEIKSNQSSPKHIEEDNEDKLNFKLVPEPKVQDKPVIQGEEAPPLPKKVDYGEIPKPPPKSKRGKTVITIPSLSEFKDLDLDDDQDENNQSSRIKSEKKRSSFLSALPAPKNTIVTSKPNSMVPHVLTKKPEVKKINAVKSTVSKPLIPAKPSTSALYTKALSKYSDSEDEDESTSGTDFFSLSIPSKIPDELLEPVDTFIPETPAAIYAQSSKMEVVQQESEEKSNSTLKSTVMNLPKEEILLKNKVDVGPKLPIPEQEFNVDTQGNLAFDNKAIEYLCGKRGVKRKNEFENINMIEINGDDIKPDERDWLVKALTEEQVIRPVSTNSGPSGQSKKKHQITYLAHQAKANEIELKNQWAQSKANRQASRSKYGF